MESVPIADLKERLRRAQEAAAKNNLAAFLLSPGPDLRYFVDYEAKALERITCLMIPSKGDPVLVVPRLEKLPAQMSGAGLLGIEILTYGEFDDPYQLIAKNITNHGSIAVDDRMWAVKAHAIKYATPTVTQVTAGTVTPVTGETKVEGTAILSQLSVSAPDKDNGTVSFTLNGTGAFAVGVNA